ncbi:MAG: glucose-6-phosphate isomerase, partial [Paludibacteraceae bacterium]|nr:glucose-6-phosphate isomerase [Paludibacteraceae bacterium]
MKHIQISIDKTFGFISEEAVKSYEKAALSANNALIDATCKGNDFLGWVGLPTSINKSELQDIQETANLLRKECEVIVVIGIGGSYLGAKAVIDALSSSFDWLQSDRKNPVVVYAGQNIGEDYMYELQSLLQGKKFGIVVISKSGTTTEPAIAFRLLKDQLEKQQGKESAQKLIVAITDKQRGALRTLATQEGYKTFVIEDNIGGRYSVLSPVGLLPIAIAGFDIEKLVEGAVEMEKNTSKDVAFSDNMSAIYAATRNELYKNGKKIEILANFHPKLHYVSEWLKQLYGESEGKENKGIFPASVDFTTDLHSMGQWIQEGERTIFETVISVEKSN